ncbi:restriction endonuclease subunit S [Klebsiella pneumoniae]|uniref:restriction endonuclease subunit S n=1 Tax=Klebsiella pneumoniae TaxID=573 RepID=UPI001953576C|nr:restriction endonuclease subunit S [Klebsiella pneumoniae]EIX9727384.1 restriction endonuclease subunit S [Klebsiella pneumoniae]MBV0394205.1 restriction endonuclease subunit S [Klebsiella pneumoniae]MBV0478827.1 restriction endonuclease subunit S [Klebsiella pneumoniae]MCB7584677.1 restriction endonuclease subunit S [Klebsiella pneumoniae]HBS0016593.1 restriction endonuclease subunit S [Klebsiella pneumoniae]
MMENQNKVMSRKVIPPGYKLTEVGVIPEDWLLQKLGLHASFRTGPFGSALHKSDYVDGGIPVVNPMQIVDGKVVPTFSMAISGDAAKKLAEFRLSVGDVVIGRRGDMGRCAVITEKENGWLCGTGSMIIRVKPSCDAAFLQRILSSASVISAIENTSVGTTMINLNQGTLRELQIVLPENKNEQIAIANALSDTDELIAILEHLIAKKQSIKTATMQQLLTGRTRLPQFAKHPDGTIKGYKSGELGHIPEDWEEREIGKFAPLQRGFDLPASKRSEGLYPVVYSNGIVNTHNHFQVKGPGVVTGRSGTLGKVHHIACDFWPHNTSLWVTKFINSDSKFVYYIFKYIGFERFASGSGVPTLNRNDAHSFKVAIPSSLKEQTAIATILSDMDAELTVLEKKLSKIRNIKQGMMQQLLTGRIRLPLDNQP